MPRRLVKHTLGVVVKNFYSLLGHRASDPMSGFIS